MHQPNTRSFTLRALSLVAALALVLPASAVAGAWAVDPAHSEVNFSVNHFFTPVSGSFDDFEVALEFDPAHPEKSSVDATIQIASVNTGNEKRDNHLRSGDWFETGKFPAMRFESAEVKKISDQQFVAYGTLTIKGESKKVGLPITLLGIKDIPEQMQAMLGGSKRVASFKAELPIQRKDYGVGVGQWAGDAVVGGEVNIEILLEAHLR